LLESLAELSDTVVDFRKIGAEEELTRLQMMLKEDAQKREMFHDAQMTKARHENDIAQGKIEHGYNMDLESVRQSFSRQQSEKGREHDLSMSLVDHRLESYRNEEVKINTLSLKATELGIYKDIMNDLPDDAKTAAFELDGGEKITTGNTAPLRGRQTVAIAIQSGISTYNMGYDTALAMDMNGNADGHLDENERTNFFNDKKNKDKVADLSFVKGFDSYQMTPLEWNKLLSDKRTAAATNTNIIATLGDENVVKDADGYVTGTTENIDYSKTLSGKQAENNAKLLNAQNGIEFMRKSITDLNANITTKASALNSKYKDLDPEFTSRDFDWVSNIGGYMESGDSAKMGEALLMLQTEYTELGKVEMLLNEQASFVDSNYAFFSSLHNDDGLMSEPEFGELITKYEDKYGVQLTDVGFRAGLNALMPAESRAFNLAGVRKDKITELTTSSDNTFEMIKGLVGDADNPIDFQGLEGIDEKTAGELVSAFGNVTSKDFEKHTEYLQPSIGEWFRSDKFMNAYPRIYDQLQLMKRNNMEIDRIKAGATPGKNEDIHTKISQLISIPGSKDNLMKTFESFQAVTADLNDTQFGEAYDHFVNEYAEVYGSDVGPIIQENLSARLGKTDLSVSKTLAEQDRNTLYGTETPFEQKYTSSEVMELLEQVKVEMPKGHTLPKFWGKEVSGVEGIFAIKDEGQMAWTGWGSGSTKGGTAAPASLYNISVNQHLKATWDKAYDNLSATDKDGWGLDVIHYGFGEQTSENLMKYMKDYYKGQSGSRQIVNGFKGEKLPKWERQIKDLINRADIHGRNMVEERIKEAMKNPGGTDYAVLYDFLMQLWEVQLDTKKGK